MEAVGLPFLEEAAAVIPGVLFEEDFDAPVTRRTESPEPEVIEAVLTVADLETAREAGRLAGLEEARGEQKAVQQALHSASLAAIGDSLAACRGDAAAIVQHAADDAAAAMLAMLAAALPSASEKLAGSELMALLRCLLPGLKREPELMLHLSPAILPGIEAELRHVFGDQLARMHCVADAKLAPADLVLVWQDGEARRDTAALWEAMRLALAPYGLPDMHALMGVPLDGQ